MALLVVRTAAAAAGEEEGGAEAVRGAARGHGLLAPHLRRRVRGGGALRPAPPSRRPSPLPQRRQLPRPPAAHPPLRGVRSAEAAAARVPTLQAPVAAAPPPRLHLRRGRRRLLQGSPLHVSYLFLLHSLVFGLAVS